MNILITGGSGFIGRNLIKFLSKDKDLIFKYCDNEKFSTDHSYDAVKSIKKISNDISELTVKDFEGIDVLIHLAAVKKHNSISALDDLELIRTNITETYRIFNLAKKCNVRQIIFASSLYAHGDMHKLLAKESDIPCPITLYGSTKLFGENILREIALNQNIDCTVVRFYFIYGRNQFTGKGYPSIFIKNMERMCFGFNPIIINDGSQKLDYLHVDDLCNLIKKIIFRTQDGFKIVNACSGVALPIKDIVYQLTEEWNNKFGKNYVVEYSGKDFTEGTYRSGSRELASLMWNWEPSISINEGISDLINWYVNQNKLHLKD
jgi:UDP-glucose 4-epimerase